ncbi:Zinc finger BED domain-containing protein 4 [Grifola frondosa]|uniref:Zinc finger BED domain-containing protein 4 n=1 Tax=Grifola frondosa TaxID=5627 RepID=A0A1C7M8C5_GRIFR|nr:Zinc finger BED domain-containing protein 4 [Grifola frondosa]
MVKRTSRCSRSNSSELPDKDPHAANQLRYRRQPQPGPSTPQEEIDIALSDDSLPRIQVLPQKQTRKRATVRRSKNLVPGSAAATAAESTPSLPPATISEKSKEHGLTDIDYFFLKGTKNVPGSQTICIPCSKLFEEARKAGIVYKGLKFDYSPSTSRTGLQVYLENHHEEEYIESCQKFGWKMQLRRQRVREAAQATSAPDGSEPSNCMPFTAQSFIRHIINFIVADDQSINVVECREFCDLLLHLRDELHETDIPRRTKIRESIIAAWKAYFEMLKADLARSVGKISLTTDIWSCMKLRRYLAITAHWMMRDEKSHSLHLKAALIAFHRLYGKHNSQNLAKVVLKLLDRAGITVKIGHITLDNAGNNGTLLEELAELLKNRDIPFDAKENHIMCFLHIINICSTHVIEEVTNLAYADAADEFVANFPASHPDQQTFEQALARDPIALGREIVRTLRASGQRRDQFDELITQGNIKKWFISGIPPQVVQLRHLQLLRDIKMRWDSAIDHYIFTYKLDSIKLTPKEWEVLQNIEFVLSVPHTVQQVMSGERTPILSGTIPSFEMFMTRWEKLGKKAWHLTDVGLKWAAKYYSRMDGTPAYIIAMLLNPAVKLSWIHEHWEDGWIEDAIEKIKTTMATYRKKKASEDIVAGIQGEDSRMDRNDHDAWTMLASQYGLDDMEIEGSATTHEEQTVEQEYSAYTTAPLSAKGTDIIKFWEISECVYPTLFSMAMDYLPIQASSVPCERVFSSSVQTDIKKRNHMKPILMEALQILKFGLKKDRLDFTTGWITSEESMVETQHSDERDILGELFEENTESAEHVMDRIIAELGGDDSEDDRDSSH